MGRERECGAKKKKKKKGRGQEAERRKGKKGINKDPSMFVCAGK